MESLKNALVKFFGVAVRGQTYLNALYLLLAFPLGIVYFVFLVTGLSVGVPLIIIWVGLLILVAVFAGWYGLAGFERWMAIGMLRVDIPPMTRQDLSEKSLWQKFTATLGNPVTWKGLVYLLAKFPLGIFSFVVLVTLLSVSFALLTTPFYYQWVSPSYTITMNGATWYQPWIIDTLGEALLVSLAGVFVTLISLHILNGLAWVSGQFARIMLGNFSTASTTPTSFVPPSAPVLPDAPAPAQ